MIRIGVVSDTHLTKVTDDFRRVMESHFRNVDYLIHAGDIIGPEVYGFLCQWNLFAVRGNMDDQALTDILPKSRIETLHGKRIGIVHGAGSWHHIKGFAATQFNDVDLIIFGHSHMPLYERNGDTEIFNPGAFTRPVSQQRTVGLIEIEDQIRCRHLPLP